MLGAKVRRTSAETVTEWNDATGGHVDETMIVDVLEDPREQAWLSDALPGLTATEIDYWNSTVAPSTTATRWSGAASRLPHERTPSPGRA